MKATLIPTNGTQLRAGTGIGTDGANTRMLTQQAGGHLDSVNAHEWSLGLTRDLVSLDVAPRPGEQVRLSLAVDSTVSRLFSTGTRAGHTSETARTTVRTGLALSAEHTVLSGDYRLRFDALGGVDWDADQATYLGGRVTVSSLMPNLSNRLPIFGDPPPAADDPGVGIFTQVDVSGATHNDMRLTVGASVQF